MAASKAVPGAAVPGAAVPGNNTPPATAGVGSAALAGAGTLTAAGSSTTHGAALAGAGTLTAAGIVRGSAALAGAGTLTAVGSASSGPPVIVNQWAATFAQPASFRTTPPALQSVVVALTPSSSVGGGSGTATAGNWLFCLVAMNERATTAGFTAGVGDDIHSFWRPGNETTSTWAVSAGAALTRTAAWYTPNLARAPGNVYVAPNGAFDAIAVLVIEVSGLGPWDTVTGIFTNYAAAATSLSLSLGAPSASAFIIGAVAGDSTTAGQAFAPGGWTALHTVTATNGTDHTCDADLTSAYIVTSGSVSVSGTAASATNLSGVLIGVLTSASSPIPAGQNPNWPYLKFEAAFGSGFQTPQDQYSWADLSSRLWMWDETTGVQYQLGDLQATDLLLDADNFDGHLSSDSASGPYAGQILTGTPLRLRAAVGTIGGVTVNRWYVIQRNLQEWPQQVSDDILRRYISGTGTDIWSAMSSSGPSPYRGEVRQDSPYAWWACDDQPLAGGVQPVSLRNSATGNTNVLNITAAPGGVSPQDAYSSGVVGPGGTDLTTTLLSHGTSGTTPSAPLPSVATYAAAQQAGFMYGDPQSSPASYQTSNPVTSNPGSAAWQQTGLQGSTGSPTWFLNCNDTSFPALSGGITVEGWFSYALAGSSSDWHVAGGSLYNQASQPYSPMTLLELATASAPVAVLQLDTSGHLNFITWSGATPTSTSIYSASDLRNGSWMHVAVTMTATAWAVYLNGGLTAAVAGAAAGMTPAWTWLIANGDLGSGGGSALSGIVHGGNVAVSHLAVYPAILPAWRITAHYCAAATGFGLLPAPVALALSTAENPVPSSTFTGSISCTPDGTEYQGSYGSGVTAFGISAVAASVAGSYTSGPSARATTGGAGASQSSISYSSAVWVSWTAVAPLVQVFTAANAGSETEAAACCGSGDSFTSGYGAAASGHGVCQTAAGTGAPPPAAASPLGDTVAQRIERILSYAGVTFPGRCIDPASLPVQAATDIGGQQAGPNIENITASDGGMLYVDNLGNLTYWQKSHLAAQYSSPVWMIGPAASGGAVIPYGTSIRWLADPQRVWNAITIQPFSPDGASLPDITPSSAATANSSQLQYGAQPKPITSYLQSAAEMQAQADWLLANFGQVQIRAESVRINAASYPAAWPLVLGVNVGDVVSVQNWQVGGGGTTGTFRVTQIKRKISFGGTDYEPEASVELTCDFEPASYWS